MTNLLSYNTFGIGAHAAHFAEVKTVAELRRELRSATTPVLVLGGGSNILFTQDWPGTVVRNAIGGIEVVRQFKNRAWVRAGGGESWHGLVQWAVSRGLGGLENLSLIPGTVGAAPVQNIGAYGVELQDLFISLEAVDLATGKNRHFRRAQCHFGYRDSVFKNTEKGRFCITSVTLSLSTDRHRIRTDYGDITKTLAEMGISRPGIADVSAAVVRIRSAKLPDPAQIGNCGSFFKNPTVMRVVFEKIQQNHATAPHYDLPDGRVKIPAGWLIEQCGWKGKRVGNTGCHDRQALVLVNHGGASGAEVVALARAIVESVEKTFGVRLEPEVNVL
ncbi:MAG: UDP-N-acetylmuramate dehydrogenase [Saprospiraceae bacterium]